MTTGIGTACCAATSVPVERGSFRGRGGRVMLKNARKVSLKERNGATNPMAVKTILSE